MGQLQTLGTDRLRSCTAVVVFVESACCLTVHLIGGRTCSLQFLSPRETGPLVNAEHPVLCCPSWSDQRAVPPIRRAMDLIQFFKCNTRLHLTVLLVDMAYWLNAFVDAHGPNSWTAGL